ncbi:hypothetical protein BCR36DRAFT_585957 [Piromyces finnis]|uniref:Trs120-domain-containing protein n=1 Tax=Piromyces finnis TaxID=1754191 RepID=A0A1Y1V161_9FUNG|nr:hypothetical protein BCR36DRAFT_585957 [Piromyces finnis]|eukprot:ORX44842.1 hypothetical protein BCR36DRAFT_585957 [Piromyces finnis]
MSLLDYAELSKIRILLVPLGNIDSETFQKHVEDISCIDRIPLQELSQPIIHKRTKFNDFRYKGNVFINYRTTYNEEHKNHVEILQPYRRILGMVGIINGKCDKNINECIQEFERISKQYGSVFSKKIFIFEPEECQIDSLDKNITLIPTIGNILYVIRAMMSDVIAEILNNFEDWAQQIEKNPVVIPEEFLAEEIDKKMRNSVRLDNISPTSKDNSKILPPSNARTKDFSSDIYQSNNTNGYFVSNNSSFINNSTPGNRSRSSSTSNRDSSSSFLRYSFEGLSNYSESSRTKKLEKLCSRKLIADLYMLAGHIDEAMQTYVDVTEQLKSMGEYFWQALAIDSYLSGMFIKSYMIENEDEDDEPETPKDRNEVISKKLLRYLEELPDLLRDLIIIYQKNNPKKVYPDLFISDLCLRFANLLNTLRKSSFKGSFVGGISYLQFNNEKHSAYHVIAQGIGITNNAGMNPQSEIATQNQDGELSYYIIKSDVSSWIMKGFESGFEHLPSLSDKISYILSAVKIYGDLGYIRKQGFFLHYLGQILKEDFYSVCRKYNITINPLRFGSPITYKSVIKTKINRTSGNSFSSYYRQSSHVPTLPTHKEVNIDDPIESDNNVNITNEPTTVEEEGKEEQEDLNSNLLDYSDFNDISFMSNAPQTPGNMTEINILDAINEKDDQDDKKDNTYDDCESIESNHSNSNSIHTNATNNTMVTNTNTITTVTTAINTTQVSNTLNPSINTSPAVLNRSNCGEIRIASIYKFPMNNIIDIMNQACEFYGVGLNDHSSALIPLDYKSPFFKANDMSIETAVSIFNKYIHSGEINKKLRNRLLFGWPQIQINILKEALEFAEILEDYESAIELIKRMLLRYYFEFSTIEQHELCHHFHYLMKKYRLLNKDKFYELNKIHKSIYELDESEMEELKESTENLSVYPPSPILIDLYPSHQARHSKIFPIKKEEIIETKDSNPFLYTPFSASKKNSTVTYFCINEPIEFTLEFTNPFTITIPIHKISLITSGVKTICYNISSDIPPLCQSYRIKISITPVERGELRIHGCKLLLFGCIEEILVPKNINSYKIENDERDKFNAKYELFNYRGIKYKSMRKPKTIDLWEKTYNIINDQGYLKVQNNSLGSQSTIEVYEGESAEFHICLQNLSNCFIEKISFGYDNVKKDDKKSNQLNPDELYETEVFESKQQPIQLKKIITHDFRELDINDDLEVSSLSTNKKIIMNEIPISMNSYEVTKFIFEVNGKIKSREIELIFEYMSEDNEDDNMVYMRQLKIPINITVHKALVLRDIDLMPAISDVNFINEIKELTNYNDYDNGVSEKEIVEESNTLIKQAGSSLNTDDYCMVSLVLYNRSNYTFDIDFFVRNDDNDEKYELQSATNIPSRIEKRILLLIKRKTLPSEMISQKIPGPEGQFIKTKLKTLTEEEDQLIRTRFWYKEDLTGGLLINNGRLRIKWRCSDRVGEFLFKEMKLTTPMINKLKEPLVHFKTSLVDLKTNEECNEISRIKYDDFIDCTVNKFYSLRFEIQNKSDHPFVPCLRIQPFQEINEGEYSINLRRKVFWTGSLQKYLPMIQPNETTTYVLPISFRAIGIYKFLYHCETKYPNEAIQDTICWAVKSLLINVKDQRS